MRKASCSSLFFALIIIFTLIVHPKSSAGWGDDSESPGYTIFPLNKTDVRLESIVVEVDAQEILHATFTLENTSLKETNLDIGLPYITPGQNLTVTVNGKEVKYEQKEYEYSTQLNWILDHNGKYRYPNKNYLNKWTVNFQGKEKKTVEASYEVAWCLWAESFPSGSAFYYVNKTAYLWNGEVKQADFYIELPKHIKPYLGSGNFKLWMRPKGYEITNNNSIHWQFSDLEAYKDFFKDLFIFVYDGDEQPFPGDYAAKEADAGLVSVLKRKFKDVREKRKYEGNIRLYTVEDLHEESIEENASRYRFFIKILRNEIFARNGRSFESQSLKEVFSYQEWYKPDSDYNDSYLNAFERKNVKFLLDYEEYNRWK